MRNQNYLALDLEYNCDGKNGTEDIIQVGLAWGNPKSNQISKKSFLVKPRNKTITLHNYITCLTGINQEDYDNNSVYWEEVVDYVRIIHDEYKPFTNPVTWGLSDAYDMRKTIKEEGLEFPYFGRRIIDVKHFFLFIESAKGRAMSGGLRSAMNKHRLKFNGDPHRADDDAKNTLRFFFYLLKRQALLEETVGTLKTLT